jgi:cell division septal protein FtsQ
VRKKKLKEHKKKTKIRYKRVLVFLVILLIFSYAMYHIFTIHITNIFITGNSYLNDQTIIELAKLEDYPLVYKTFGYKIEDTLKKNVYIKNVKVYHKHFKEIYIEIEENIPLVHLQDENKTLLLDGTKVDDKFNVPVLINTIPSDLLSSFLNNYSEVSNDIRGRISEIKYNPNVDNERLLITMNDGNYVYVTLSAFININNYLDIIKNFPDKKGILYLDSGNLFKVFEN